MRIKPATVDAAFLAFQNRYVEKAKRAWDLDHHSKLWANARDAVATVEKADLFLRVLAELRSHWQIARGRGSKMLEAGKVLPLLHQQDVRAREKRLSEISSNDVGWLLQTVRGVADIKRVKGEPSLMAISKVLHFYNPRLFVIVDRAMVWDWALNHNWIWNQILACRDQIDCLPGCKAPKRDDAACDVSSYVAVLIWAGELLRNNPHVTRQFAEYLRGHCTIKAALPADLETYEAVAVEWLMLGLVELPPAGVELSDSRTVAIHK